MPYFKFFIINTVNAIFWTTGHPMIPLHPISHPTDGSLAGFIAGPVFRRIGYRTPIRAAGNYGNQNNFQFRLNGLLTDRLLVSRLTAELSPNFFVIVLFSHPGRPRPAQGKQ
jgi:hypothetical protein